MQKHTHSQFRQSVTQLLVIALISITNIGNTQDLILDAQQGIHTTTISETDAIVETAIYQPFQFLRKSLEDDGVLTLDIQREVHQELYNQRAEYLELAIPVDAEHTIVLDLEKKDILPPNFKMKVTDGTTLNINSVFYHGTVKGTEESIVAVSIHKKEITIFINDNHGVYTLGKKEDTNDYVFYNEHRVVPAKGIGCDTEDRFSSKVKEAITGSPLKSNSSATVEIFLAIDYESVQLYGNATAAITHTLTVFNQVAAVYAFYSIPIAVAPDSEVWGQGDSFGDSAVDSPDGSAILEAFGRHYQNNHTGTLAHLITIADNDVRGRAYTGTLCSEYGEYEDEIGPYISGPYGWSRIKPTYQQYPTFSESVLVFAHELGHNFGSTHTHNCAWGPNKDEAIDNCVDPPESCGSTTIQNNVIQNPNYIGTLMGYCTQERS
ncbi:MAG: M12 family metallo-peptidase, partial [Bacteroidota bacterium]